LNFGSVCTLVAFTRSDVLELRSLSVVGSACSVVYQLTLQPVRYAPIVWSLLFAGVNSVKIQSILRERGSAVRLTGEQERIYVRHFMPHGITPKQFEAVLGCARIRRYPKGAAILKQGDRVERVYLVVRGATRATILGRRVSAASMPLDMEEDEGGVVDRGAIGGREARSSAWIGEMTFLEKYWIKEQLQVQRRSKKPEIDEALTGARSEVAVTVQDRPGEVRVTQPKGNSSKAGAGTSSGTRTPDPEIQRSRAAMSKDVSLAAKRTIRPSEASAAVVPEAKAERSMCTITAVEDCTVLEWSQEDFENLMERSTDLRAALTRALSSALVGKVINFTLSKSQAHRSWSQWLDDWKHSDGATIRVGEQAEGEDGAVAPEALPTHPIRKFA
jgi:CRP-like cAMP-binding protein